ncbi:uncharacterized protein [Dermacentor albipictus]|uniref:uncharacterized protein isoform X3 n=1 Tax=Dermacentor albipictus TaxID=60249 RepID=UPI0031FBB208
MSALYSARYVLIGTITLQGMFICFGKPTAFPTISDGNGTTAPPYKCGQVVYVTSPMASCGSPIPLQTHYGSYSAELFHSFALFGCERDSKCEASKNGTCSGDCICVWVDGAEKGACWDLGDSVI